MQQRRVVVTGMGILCPVGNTVAESWQNIRQGKSGISLISRFDTSELPVRIGGEVRGFDPEAHFGRREFRRMDRITHLAMAATEQAIADAGLDFENEDRTQVGVLIGTGLGGLETILNGHDNYKERGTHGVSPLFVPMMLPDNPSGKVSITYGLRGPNMTLSSACSTGNNAIGESAAWIQRGLADVVITGATEAGVTALSVAGFNNMTAISRRNKTPEAASRPFDRDRDGFVMSEGAAILVLEALEHAQARGARIYAEVVGYGMTSDAYHVTAPASDGEGAMRAMQLALKDAGLQPEDIDYINAHGTSTPLNDAMETLAIKRTFGELAYSIPVSSTKSMTGHVMGAGAAVEAVFSIMALQDNFIPPTINLDNPDPACDLDYVPHQGRQKTLRHVMSNSFGFGGHNVVVIFGKLGANANGHA
ncbi:MAG: beta-ketoacyl-ACP synthase II [Anaerolineae bacterium]|nr:beta-ketoacyl-ACP synthase II [Anaerolineae bacterium]